MVSPSKLFFGISAACMACAAFGQAEKVGEFESSIVCIKSEGQMFNGQIERGGGSGFFIDEKGSVLTSAHVLLSPSNYRKHKIEGTVRYSKGLEYEDKVFEFNVHRVDRRRDLAVIVPTKQLKSAAAPLGGPSDVRRGRGIYKFGCPATFGPSISGGILSNVSNDAGGSWLTDVAINPGDSGSPVFIPSGRVIGIASGGARFYRISTADRVTEVPTQGMNFVLPLSWATSGVIKDAGIEPIRFAATSEKLFQLFYQVPESKFPRLETVLAAQTFRAPKGYEFSHFSIEDLSSASATPKMQLNSLRNELTVIPVTPPASVTFPVTVSGFVAASFEPVASASLAPRLQKLYSFGPVGQGAQVVETKSEFEYTFRAASGYVISEARLRGLESATRVAKVEIVQGKEAVKVTFPSRSLKAMTQADISGMRLLTVETARSRLTPDTVGR